MHLVLEYLLPVVWIVAVGTFVLRRSGRSS